MSESLLIEQECSIYVTSLSSTGEGIGSIESGLKVFVDGALPGENVRVRIEEIKKKYAIGKLIEILSPSSLRKKPECPLFGACGGCQIMHLSYEAQLEVKGRKVSEALTRIGRLSDYKVNPCRPSPQLLHYRNKIQLPVLWQAGKKIIGLYRKQTHEIIPLSRCLIQSLQGEKIFLSIEKSLTIPSVRYVLIKNGVFREESLVILVTDGTMTQKLKDFSEQLMQEHPTLKGVIENVNKRVDNVILGPSFHLLSGQDHLHEQLLGLNFKISPAAFFQVNPWQTENLYRYVLEQAQIKPQDMILDAYCGVGTLALFAAQRGYHAYGTESVAKAIADAKDNARLNHIENVTFLCGKAEELIHHFAHIDTLFLNPPRKGCDQGMIDRLLKKPIDRLIYISCDPATLARDLALLSPTYTIKSIQPFDMFPQTMHVETVTVLTKMNFS